jgi:TatA/E family protein of Tat protein translocase
MEHGLFGWIIIIVGIVFLFGNPKRLTDFGRGLGSFLREFKAAQREDPAPAPQEAAKPVLQPAQEAPKLVSPEKKDA